MSVSCSCRHAQHTVHHPSSVCLPTGVCLHCFPSTLWRPTVPPLKRVPTLSRWVCYRGWLCKSTPTHPHTHHTQCDVVLTKDCQLVCRHEPNVANTTDAAQKFPNLVRNYTIDGVQETGVFTNDLTLAQIKTLTAKQRLYFRYVGWSGVGGGG